VLVMQTIMEQAVTKCITRELMAALLVLVLVLLLLRQSVNSPICTSLRSKSLLVFCM
jgi:hypothetical protein